MTQIFFSGLDDVWNGYKLHSKTSIASFTRGSRHALIVLYKTLIPPKIGGGTGTIFEKPQYIIFHLISRKITRWLWTRLRPKNALKENLALLVWDRKSSWKWPLTRSLILRLSMFKKSQRGIWSDQKDCIYLYKKWAYNKFSAYRNMLKCGKKSWEFIQVYQPVLWDLLKQPVIALEFASWPFLKTHTYCTNLILQGITHG